MTRVIDFPHEWATSTPIDNISFRHDADGLRIFGVLLEDGSNLWVLVYPGGHRFARTAHMIDWGIEERYGGKPPRGRDLRRVNEEWRRVLDMMISAGEQTDADMRAMGLPTSRKRGDA